MPSCFAISYLIASFLLILLSEVVLVRGHQVPPEQQAKLSAKLAELEEAYDGLSMKCEDFRQTYMRGDLDLDELLDCLLEKGKKYAENLHFFSQQLDLRHHNDWTLEDCHYVVPVLMKLLDIGFPYYGSIIDLGGPGPYPRHQRGPEESFMAAANTFSHSLLYMFNDYTCSSHLNILQMAEYLDRAYTMHMKTITSRVIDGNEALLEDMHAHTPFMDLQEVTEEAIREYGRTHFDDILETPAYDDMTKDERQTFHEERERYIKRRKGELSDLEIVEAQKWKELFVMIQPALFRIWEEQGGYEYIHGMYHVHHHEEL